MEVHGPPFWRAWIDVVEVFEIWRVFDGAMHGDGMSTLDAVQRIGES